VREIAIVHRYCPSWSKSRFGVPSNHEIRGSIQYLQIQNIASIQRHPRSSHSNQCDHLSYSCHFWAHRVQALPPDDEILEEVRVKDFIHTQLLYWLEVMSLVKAVGMASPALLLTSSWLKVSNLIIYPSLVELKTTRIKTTKSPFSFCCKCKQICHDIPSPET
jgi:hypothetical protein